MSRLGGGGLLQRLFQGARDRRRSPGVREGQTGPTGRFDAQGNLRPGQPPQRPGGEETSTPSPGGGPNPLDPGTQLTQEGSQRRQDTRFKFEEAKGALEKAQGQKPGLGRRRGLDEKRRQFLQASVEAGKSAGKADILTPEEQSELEEGDQIQDRLSQQGALSPEDLTRAKEMGLLDSLDPEERTRVENTVLLGAPTLPGGSGQSFGVDRTRLTQLAPLDEAGNVVNQQGGGQQGVTQILNPENVDEFLFNVGNQSPEVKNQLFQAISKAGGADAIFETSGGNISEALFLFGDQGATAGSQFGSFGEDTFGSPSEGGDLLEAIGVLFGSEPNLPGNNLPGTTEPVPTGIPGVPSGVGQSTQDQQSAMQNFLGALKQLGFGGQS